MARDINAELGLATFPEGVTAENLDQFLDGVDLYIDGLDFFALEIRRTVFAACYEKGIPAVTAAPLGMGSALLVFMPGKMDFDSYFRMAGHPPEEQALRFMLGLAPARLQQRSTTRASTKPHLSARIIPMAAGWMASLMRSAFL